MRGEQRCRGISARFIQLYNRKEVSVYSIEVVYSTSDVHRHGLMLVARDAAARVGP